MPKGASLVCNEDQGKIFVNDAEIAKELRTKSIKVGDPAAEFAEWAYAIPEHHYATFGVRYQQFMKNKVPYFSWAKAVPPPLTFIVGDVFYLRRDECNFIQVAADWDAFRLEVHCGLVGINVPRKAFLALPSELSDWLKGGVKPESCRQIDFSESQAGLLQWQLLEKTNPPSI
jgi:hypothetical protein